MPDLLHALPANDLAFLRIVAELWGLELTAAEPAEAVAELVDLLADADLIEETLAALPADARAALGALAAEGGRMTWVGFSRRFGGIREMGPGRRDRDRPHLRPNSPAETLYYRALLARAFFETPSGPQEFAYVPDDFLMFIEPAAEEIGFDDAPLEPGASDDGVQAEGVSGEEKEPVTPTPMGARKPLVLGRPASPGERAFIIPASDRILDDATTLLAALRSGLTPPETPVPARVVREFLAAAGLVDSPLPPGEGPGVRVQLEAVKSFLEAPRAEALSALAEAWRASETFNELRQLSGLAFEGEWANQPLATREFLLSLLDALPGGQWWSLAAFVRELKAKCPDFQRPAGDYDSWFIRRESDGAYLRGFANWDAVDGALVRYLIEGPLFWLGRAGLAASGDGTPAAAFRLRYSDPGRVLDALEQEEEKGKVAMTSAGQISVERLVPRAARYQIARFCEWEGEKGEVYRYRVTAGSLKTAGAQGLKAGQLLGLLARHSGGQVPPALVKALRRWEAQGTEARLEQVTVLRVSKPEVLNELKKSPAARFLGETLGPTAVVIQPGAAPRVLAALAELGLLAESSGDGGPNY